MPDETVPQAARTAHRVLYIDDDPGIGRLVQRHLQRAGFTVTLAQDGEEGERLAASGDFDAIGLDHYMPGRDGLEVLERLRALPAAPPVIFCTGAEEPRIAVTALKSGAADYVVKDVQGGFIELLAASIVQEIRHARLRREREQAVREVRESRDRLERLAAQQAVLLHARGGVAVDDGTAVDLQRDDHLVVRVLGRTLGHGHRRVNGRDLPDLASATACS